MGGESAPARAVLRKKAYKWFRELDGEMRQLRKLISDNKNTKGEIKKIIKILSGLVSSLMTKVMQ